MLLSFILFYNLCNVDQSVYCAVGPQFFSNSYIKFIGLKPLSSVINLAVVFVLCLIVINTHLDEEAVTTHCYGCSQVVGRSVSFLRQTDTA